MAEKSFGETFGEIQKNLKAPKGQHNKFGNYKYRSCEDIVEAVKQILPNGYSLVLSDELVHLGDRFYVKATATVYNCKDSRSASGFAREQQTKKGMDESQITGSSSSYARKYALNGLFCIDDTKDADTVDNSKEGVSQPKETNWKQVSVKITDAIGLSTSEEGLQEVLDEYGQEIGDMPEPFLCTVEAVRDARRDAFSRGDFEPILPRLTHVTEAEEFLKNIETVIPTIKKVEIIDKWVANNYGKIESLDDVLKAKKWQTDEGSPTERAQAIIANRIHELKGEVNGGISQ